MAYKADIHKHGWIKVSHPLGGAIETILKHRGEYNRAIEINSHFQKIWGFNISQLILENILFDFVIGCREYHEMEANIMNAEFKEVIFTPESLLSEMTALYNAVKDAKLAEYIIIYYKRTE